MILTDLHLHDAVIVAFTVDVPPLDSIALHLDCSGGPIESSRGVRVLTFEQCRLANFRLGFGVSPADTIRSAGEVAGSALLAEVRASWERVGVVLPTLTHYRIETNTAASVLDIVAAGFSFQ